MKIKYLINFLSIGSIFSGNFISESCSKLVNALPDSLKEKFSNPYILCTLGGFTLGSGLSYLLFKDSHSAMSDVEVDTQPLKTHQAGIQATAERQEIATQAVPEKKDIDIQVFFDMAPRALEILNAGLPVEENLITSLDSQREEIFTLMSRFDPNYERSYIEGLESNNKKIEEKTGYKIPLRSLYLFLGLSNEVAFNLPFWVLSKLIDEKVDYLISNGLEKEKASWL